MTGLDDLTSMRQCNGLARRILKDLEGYSTKKLKEAYKNGYNHGEEDYEEIIKLAELLKTLKE